MYSLSSFRNLSLSLVFLPVNKIRRPVAKGSRVPVWPTLTFLPAFSERTRRILATTPKEVIPAGLSIRIISSSIWVIITDF